MHTFATAPTPALTAEGVTSIPLSAGSSPVGAGEAQAVDPCVTDIGSRTSERQCSIKKHTFFITAPDARGIAARNVHAVCCLTPSLYHPVTCALSFLE